MHLKFFLVAATALACAGSVDKSSMKAGLPAMPETVLEEISEAGSQIGPGTRVPELFERGEWNLPGTGRKLLALLTGGAEKGSLQSWQAGFMEQISAYLVTFQLDEDEDNFALPGAKLSSIPLRRS